MVKTYKPAAVIAALILGGCSIADDGLWPDTADHGGARADAQYATTAAWDDPIAPADPLVLDLPAAREVSETDTVAGRRIAALQSDLNLLIAMVTAQNDELRAITGGTAQISRRHQSSVEAVRARLGTGTAPGNPALMAQVQAAEGNVDRMADGTSRLTDLAARVAANQKLARYVTTSAAAVTDRPGSVEEDAQQAASIVDDTAQVMTQNDRLLTEVNASFARNNALVARERTNLSVLALAVRKGDARITKRSWMASNGGSMLMVIGFDRADTDYEKGLQDAVTATLDRQPEARFELIAVLPQRGGSGEAAKRNGERVLRSLIAMGLPTDRVILVSETSDLVSEGEVQVYAR